MVNKCPNKSHKDWKDIVNKYGEDIAYALYIKNGEEIPSPSYADSILNNNPNINKQNQFINQIRKALIDQLELMGIGTGAIKDFESRLSLDDPQGFTPESIREAIEGLAEIINEARLIHSPKILDEKFSFFVDKALPESPITNRLTTAIGDIETIQEILGTDFDALFNHYKGDIKLLSDRARVRLIHDYVIGPKQIPKNHWGTLLGRYRNNVFSKTFSKGSVPTLRSELSKAEQALNTLTTPFLGTDIQFNFSLDNTYNRNRISNNKKTLKQSEGTLKSIVEIKAKQLNIAKDKLSEADRLRAEVILNKLEDLKNEERFNEGILKGIETAYEDILEIMNSNMSINIDSNTDLETIRKQARYLKNIKSIVDAYSPLVEGVLNYMSTEEYKSQELIDLDTPIKDLQSVLKKVDLEYKNNSFPLFEEFISRYAGDLIGSNIGGVVFTKEMLTTMLKEANADIGIGEKFLFSMSNSSDMMLRLIEQPIKEARNRIRDKVNDLVKDLQFAQEKLEKAGFETSFMYELNSKGIPTGYFIQETDLTKFKKDREAVRNKLDEKYGKPTIDNNKRSLWFKEFYSWEEANTEKDGTPNKIKYKSDAFDKLKPAQKEFYNTIIEIKKEMMQKLPESKQDLYLAPQYRKDFLDIVKDSSSISEAYSKFSTFIGDKWLDREDDDVYGNRGSLKNFDGTKLQSLPIYYTNKLTNPEQLSMDLVSTMALYADMAVSYEEMDNVLDIMEVGRDIMRDRKIQETKGGKGLVENIKAYGRTITSKVYKPQGTSNFIDRINEFYSAQIYGVTQKEEGGVKIPLTEKTLSYAKLSNNLNQLTAMNTYAFNLLGGVANVLTGKAMIRIETIAGEYFGYKESTKADLIYSQWLPEVISDMGRRRNRSKASLMLEKFNVFQDYENSLREIRMNKKNLFARYITSSSAFFINNCGEHYLQSKSFLAMSQRYMLKDAKGNEINLLEAFEVRKNDKGIEKLHIKEGVTKLDGSEFVDKDIWKFSRKVAKVNQNLHGIYNREDMNVLQTTAIGRMAFMFRKWMPPAWSRRLNKENFDFDLNEVQEGYYRGVGRFLKNLGADLRHGRMSLLLRWGELSDKEKMHFRRMLTEVSTFMSMALLFSLLSNAWDGEDAWYKSFVLYQLRRQQTELGVMIPSGYLQLKEGMTILKSPAAAVNYSDHLINVLKFWEMFQDPVQSGQYEGWNKYATRWIRPLPYHNSIRRAFNPEESLKFFDND